MRTGLLNFRHRTVDPKTATTEARARFPHPKAEVLASESVRLKISAATRPNASVIPQRALTQGPTGE